MKRLVLAVAALLPLTLLASDPYVPTDAERARWTMYDLQSWRTAFDAYKLDHKVYPTAKTPEEARAAVEPMYILHAPMADAWGHAYQIESNGTGFRLISAGADGTFQPETWSVGGRMSSFAGDAVATNEGRWLFRFWEMR